MLETREKNAARPVPQPAARAAGCVEDLALELERQRVRPKLLRTPGGVTAGGATLRVAVCDVLQSESAAAQLVQTLCRLLHDAVPVTLSLTDLGHDDAAITSLENFCAFLRAHCRADGVSTQALGVSIHSHVVPLPAYVLICGALLGEGPRYVLLDSLQMRHHDDDRIREAADRNWSLLWQRRGLPAALAPAYAASVTTRCPLLGDEAALTVLPEGGVQVPPGTAWLPLEIRLTDFSDGRGRLYRHDLERALQRAVDVADRLLEHLHWPLPALAEDAWHNRRLAFSIRGIGDLVAERGADPTDLRCLKWIDRTLARLHAVLWNRSRERALQAEPLPALLRADPTAGEVSDVHRSDWQVRWRRALASWAVRHRNLLVLSPYSVLPAHAGPAAAYMDLLPVLRHADACSFSVRELHGFRNRAEFIAFHRRAWAVMQRRNEASLVAAGV